VTKNTLISDYTELNLQWNKVAESRFYVDSFFILY